MLGKVTRDRYGWNKIHQMKSILVYDLTDRHFSRTFLKKGNFIFNIELFIDSKTNIAIVVSIRPARVFWSHRGFEIMKWSGMNPGRLRRGEAWADASVMHWVIALQHAGGRDMMRQATFSPHKHCDSRSLRQGRTAQLTEGRRPPLAQRNMPILLIEESFNNIRVHVFLSLPVGRSWNLGRHLSHDE